MSFLSVLKAIGHGAEKVIGVADGVNNIPAVQALEALVLPPYVPKLIQLGLDAVTHAQTVSVQVAAAANLSGSQKMAIALSAFNDAYLQIAKEAGIPAEPAKAQAILQAAFNLLSEIPSNITAPSPDPAAAAAAPALFVAPAAAVAAAPAPAPIPAGAEALLSAFAAPLSAQEATPGLHNVVPQ